MRLILLLLTGLLLVSCADTPSQPGAFSTAAVSWERDEWGHRPGPRRFHTVYLDAGHGGHDSGAVSPHNGLQEKHVALDTVKRIERELHGVEVILMRDDDRFVDLDVRAARASERDGAILVSVHYNAGASGADGPEVYWWRVDSFGLARRCQRAMTGIAGRGRGDAAVIRRRLRLTRNPDVPCVLLELGYLSHSAEARRIADPGYRQQLAEAIARAILEQRTHGDPPGPLPQPLFQPPSRPTDPPWS